MLPSNPFNIPNYLEAATPKDLQKQMLQNNIKKGYEFIYFDIQYVGNKWYCWYYENLEMEVKRG